MRLALHRPARPLWLITLADLSLLLVGFFVFLQATAHKEQKQQDAIQAGIRKAFGGEPEPRLAVDANVVAGFAPGSSELPASAATILTWAREALADPRTRLVVTGYADGSPSDRIQGSALALAALRADTVARSLGGLVPADRLRVEATAIPGPRRVTLTISYDP
ncbi:flagellar motor protein MotB [Sphingomonas sp.]|jgi:flagellar motor protein MotB|uniref:flagellar motor protein MotB n=1 Tax=Sphingomonas sp. TaxID=28214 RepID=UPI002DE93D26|nr:flagellar motor protein MotB [Sphingomonas sp.]